LALRFKRAWRRAVRRGKSLRPQARGSSPAGEQRSVRPENVVWIFGTGRSGSTWLGSIMGGLDGCAMWNEPLVGNLFGNFHYFRVGGRKTGGQYILGEPYKETWLGPMRDLVLGGAVARFPEVSEDGYLIIKEPNGSVGAPLLMEALPESRMIFLIRDPRDVVSSTLDGARKGNWLYERKDKGGWKRDALPDENPDAFTRRWANVYMQQAGNAKKAYDAHRGPKVMIRYEDLRADTLGTLRRIYSTLSIPVNEVELARAVEKHSWENIPEKKKGGGKFYRKATPGGWREDLTPKQIKQVERITAPLLEEYYSGRTP
jgi:Sulfotransferase family